MTADDADGTAEIVTSHDVVKFRLIYGTWKAWLEQWRRAAATVEDPGNVILNAEDLDGVIHALRAGDIQSATFRPDGGHA